MVHTYESLIEEVISRPSLVPGCLYPNIHCNGFPRAVGMAPRKRISINSLVCYAGRLFFSHHQTSTEDIPPRYCLPSREIKNIPFLYCRWDDLMTTNKPTFGWRGSGWQHPAFGLGDLSVLLVNSRQELSEFPPNYGKWLTMGWGRWSVSTVRRVQWC